MKFSQEDSSFTPLIKASKATSLNNSFTLSISSLNLFKYDHVDSPSYRVTPNNFVELFMVGILVLKCATSSTQIEPFNGA